MRLEACLVFLLNVVVGLRRGPHHPHGQTPVEQKHHHYKPMGSESLTSDTQLLHDVKHLEEDSVILSSEALRKMSPEELEFHYFSAHDYDKNLKLDGLELLKAVYHTIEHEEPDEDNTIEKDSNNLENYMELVDKTLESDDIDGDGYISYAEYKTARARNDGKKTPQVLAAKS